MVLLGCFCTAFLQISSQPLQPLTCWSHTPNSESVGFQSLGPGDWWHENARPEKTRGLAGTFRCWVAKLGKWTITHLVWWVSLFSHLCFFTKWLSKMLSYEWISHYNPIYFPTKRWSSIIPFNYPFSKDPLDNPIIMSLSSRQTIKTSS